MEDLVTYVKVQLSIYYNDNETSYYTLYRVLLSGTGWCVCDSKQHNPQETGWSNLGYNNVAQFYLNQIGEDSLK